MLFRSHKVHGESEFLPSILDALSFDNKVLIEEAISARELEVGILEVNGILITSLPGEIKIDPKFEFYDFESKYLDGATRVEIPPEITDEKKVTIQEFAKLAFRALGCRGFARVDFFLDRDSGEIYLNEINTIPGFTATSVYPKLMASVGISYKEVITNLINHAL